MITVLDDVASTGLHSVSAAGDQTFAVGEGSSEGWAVHSIKKFGNLQLTLATSALYRNTSVGETTTLIVDTSAGAIVEGQL